MNSNDKKRLIEDYFKKVCELLKNKLQEKEFSTNWEVHLLPYIGRPYYKPITIRHKNKASKDYNHTVTFEFNHSKGLLYNGMYGIIANNNKFHEYHGYRGDIIYDEHYPDIYENAQKKFKYQKHKAAQCWPLFIDFYNNKCWLDDDLIEKLHTFYEKEEKSELFKETEAMVSNMLTMVEVLDDILKWNNDSLCAQIHQYAAEQSLNLYTLEKEINYYLHELIYVENNVCTIVFLNRGTKERLGELVGYAREALQMPVELLYAKDIQEGRSLHQPIPLVEGYSEDFEELYNLLLDGDKTKLFIISGEAAIHCECDKNKNICYLNFLYTDTEDDNYVKIEYDDFTFGRFISLIGAYTSGYWGRLSDIEDMDLVHIPQVATKFLTFNSFLNVGSNDLAYQAAKAVAEGNFLHSPLYIYGAAGLGKTRLMDTIASELRREKPQINIMYVYIKNYKFEDFKSYKEIIKDRIESIDLLILDDIQLLEGEALETFLDLLDSAHLQVVVTSDKPLDDMDERIRTHFAKGTLCEIKLPTIQEKRAMVLQRSEDIGFKIDDSVAFYIAELGKSVNDLLGELTVIQIRHSHISMDYGDMEISLELVRDLLNFGKYSSNWPFVVKLAEQGNIKAQLSVASRLFFGGEYCGQNVEQDYIKAAELLHKLAGKDWSMEFFLQESKRSMAKAMLAIMFRDGDGVEQDAQKAAEWYNKAKKSDYDRAFTDADLAQLEMCFKGMEIENGDIKHPTLEKWLAKYKW